MADNKKQAGSSAPSQDGEAITVLKDEINYWNMKSSDLFLDLETLKGEQEQDDDQIQEELERLYGELKSVQTSLDHIKQRNSQLRASIREKREDVDHQQELIAQRNTEIRKTSMKYDDFMEQKKRMSEAPDLTVQEYIHQLSDRGDMAKLQLLNNSTYTKMSMLHAQQAMGQLNLLNMQPGQMNGMASGGGEEHARNGAPMPQAPPQFQFGAQINGMGGPQGFQMPNGGQPFMGNMMFGGQSEYPAQSMMQGLAPNGQVNPMMQAMPMVQPNFIAAQQQQTQQVANGAKPKSQKQVGSNQERQQDATQGSRGKYKKRNQRNPQN